jgi:NADPH:quinone reductase-like Zn-dependent oxidoreductase
LRSPCAFSSGAASSFSISISGPPDPAFAKALGLNLFMKLVFRVLSWGVQKKAERLDVGYGFLFMRAEGRQRQLGEITSLIEAGAIRPVVDKVFPFVKTRDALAYAETGRAKGKVVIELGG